MRTKPIIAGAVLIAILLLITIGFVTARPSSPAITVRHVKSVQSGRVASVTFGVTNHTTKAYMIYPFSIQALNGSTWTNCFSFDTNRIPDVVGPHGFLSSIVEATNLPTASALRLKLLAQKELGGLDRVRMQLFLRLCPVPLGSGPWFDLHQATIMSEEFVEPQQK